jgi:diaminopimelate epimerase
MSTGADGMNMEATPGIPFEKWSGGGNDFILITADALPRGVVPATLARGLCRRGVSVGADGLIVIDGAHGRLWNPDGSQPAFCGNGARCLAAFLLLHSGARAVDLRLGEIDTRAWHAGQEIGVEMPAPHSLERRVPDEVIGRALGEHAAELIDSVWVAAGVPHLVLRFRGRPTWLRELTTEVAGIGARLRWDPLFGSDGTNVDFVCAAPAGTEDEVLIRTYERGVEGETLSCGTGAIAAAFLLLGRKGAGSIALRTQAGVLLRVQRKGPTWALLGPAQCVYDGVLPNRTWRLPPPAAS